MEEIITRGYVYNTESISLHKEPLLGSEVLYDISHGQILFVDLSFENKIFYKVIYNNLIGYCVKSFIQLEN